MQLLDFSHCLAVPVWNGRCCCAQTDTIAQFRQSLTPDYTAVSPTPNKDVASVYLSPNSCPFDINPTETTQGTLSLSNKHVPGRQDTTTWNRFFWVVQYAVGQVRHHSFSSYSP
jgi:hypothetical protein